MINFFICLLISVSISIGMTIILVEKGKDWPIKRYKIILQLLLKKIHWKAPQLLYCTTCTSFWTTFISDCVMFLFSYFLGYGFYWLWPWSGCIACGIIWIIIEFLNALDNKGENTIFVENNNSKEIKNE